MRFFVGLDDVYNAKHVLACCIRLPKSRGGGDRIENLQWLCREANIAKRHMTDDEFITLCVDVTRLLRERNS